jgi:hypothetical protein
MLAITLLLPAAFLKDPQFFVAAGVELVFRNDNPQHTDTAMMASPYRIYQFAVSTAPFDVLIQPEGNESGKRPRMAHFLKTFTVSNATIIRKDTSL